MEHRGARHVVPNYGAENLPQSSGSALIYPGTPSYKRMNENHKKILPLSDTSVEPQPMDRQPKPGSPRKKDKLTDSTDEFERYVKLF